MSRIAIFVFAVFWLIAALASASDHQVPVGNTVTAIAAGTPKVIDGSTAKMTYFKLWETNRAYDVIVWLGDSVTATALYVPAAIQPFEYCAYNSTLTTSGVCIDTTVSANVYFYSTRNHDMD